MKFTSWTKASVSHFEENACVEIGTAPGYVGIRDTKQAEMPDGLRTVLVVSTATFGAFLTGLRG